MTVFIAFSVARGFVERCKYQVLLATKREEEGKVAFFLTDLTRRGEWLLPHQQMLVTEDERRASEATSVASSPPGGDEVEAAALPLSSEQSREQIAKLCPPDDLLLPPPEPVINMESVSDHCIDTRHYLMPSDHLSLLPPTG